MSKSFPLNALFAAIAARGAASREVKALALYEARTMTDAEPLAYAINNAPASVKPGERAQCAKVLQTACERRAAECPAAMLDEPAPVIRWNPATKTAEAYYESAAETRARVESREIERNATREAKHAQLVADIAARQLAELASLPADELAAAVAAAA